MATIKMSDAEYDPKATRGEVFTCIECKHVILSVSKMRFTVHDFDITGPICTDCIKEHEFALNEINW